MLGQRQMVNGGAGTSPQACPPVGERRPCCRDAACGCAAKFRQILIASSGCSCSSHFVRAGSSTPHRCLPRATKTVSTSPRYAAGMILFRVGRCSPGSGRLVVEPDGPSQGLLEMRLHHGPGPVVQLLLAEPVRVALDAPSPASEDRRWPHGKSAGSNRPRPGRAAPAPREAPHAGPGRCSESSAAGRPSRRRCRRPGPRRWPPRCRPRWAGCGTSGPHPCRGSAWPRRGCGARLSDRPG